MIAQFPLGGMTWDFMNYVLGFARLGHEVYYIEDSGQWPYNPTADGKIKTCEFNVDYLARIMAQFGLDDRWAYRFPWKDQWFGLSDARRGEVVETADLVVNVSGTIERPEAYRAARRLAYIDTDPVFTQLKLARGEDYLRKVVDAHDVFFSFGECPGPEVPDTGDTWLPTRQPIVVEEWEPAAPHRNVFTTVMTWLAYNPVEYEGKSYGQKDIEFRKFMDLPERVAPTVLEVAANAGKKRKMPRDLMQHRGWSLVDPQEVCADFDDYRSYIQGSRAEWSVAKHGYVQGRSGWFSCRSACYLAAGRPVVVQETGFSKVFPVGWGIVPFTDLESAVAGIRSVEENYPRHAEAARSLAEEWFDSAKVLSSLVDRAMA